MSSSFLLSVFQIRLLPLSSLTTTHFLDRNGINLDFIVFYGNCNVRVICDDAVSAVPDVHQLSAVCFPDKAIVIEFIDHNSFPRPERDQSPSWRLLIQASVIGVHFKGQGHPLRGGERKQQATLKEKTNKQMRRWRGPLSVWRICNVNEPYLRSVLPTKKKARNQTWF